MKAQCAHYIFIRISSAVNYNQLVQKKDYTVFPNQSYWMNERMDGRVDGWMTSKFTFLSTVFQSNQDYERLIMKDFV